MGISIKGKGGGARVTIDGKPVTEKIELEKNKIKHKNEISVSYSGSNLSASENNEIVQIDKNMYAFVNNKKFCVLENNINEGDCKIITTNSEASEYYRYINGYENKTCYSISSENLYEHVFSNNQFSKTLIHTLNESGSTNFSYSKKEKKFFGYYLLGGGANICKLYIIDKETNKSTKIAEHNFKMPPDCTNVRFGKRPLKYKNVIYCPIFVSKDSYDSFTRNVVLIKFDLNNKTSTQLWDFKSKFKPDFIVGERGRDRYDTLSIEIDSFGNLIFIVTGKDNDSNKWYVYEYTWNEEKDIVSRKQFEIEEYAFTLRYSQFDDKKIYQGYGSYKDKFITVLLENIYRKKE